MHIQHVRAGPGRTSGILPLSPSMVQLLSGPKIYDPSPAQRGPASGLPSPWTAVLLEHEGGACKPYSCLVSLTSDHVVFLFYLRRFFSCKWGCRSFFRSCNSVYSVVFSCSFCISMRACLATSMKVTVFPWTREFQAREGLSLDFHRVREHPTDDLFLPCGNAAKRNFHWWMKTKIHFPISGLAKLFKGN